MDRDGALHITKHAFWRFIDNRNQFDQGFAALADDQRLVRCSDFVNQFQTTGFDSETLIFMTLSTRPLQAVILDR